MGAVFEEQARSGWLSNIWEEHRSWVVTFALLAVSLVIWKIHGGETIFPQSWIESFPFAQQTDAFKDKFFPLIQPTTRAMAAGVVWFYESMVDFLTFTQWQVVFVILVLPAFAYGGLRLGLLAIIAVGSWLVLDFWDESMETLSLMCISILIAIVIGEAIVSKHSSDRFSIPCRRCPPLST
jgi:glycine betaine/proline transport system permease protein